MIRVFLLLLACVLPGCKKHGDAIVARLEQSTALVERMPRAQAPWQPARDRDTFVIGSGVRTGPASKAKLRVGKNGTLDVEENSIVYFTRTPGHQRSDLRVEAGVAELETGDETIRVGEAVLDPNTRARLETGPGGTTLVVTVGRAVLENGELGPGERVTLGATRDKPASAPRPSTPPAIAPVHGTRIAVLGASARIGSGNGAPGTRELPVGEHVLPAGTLVTVPEGSTVEIARGGARAVTAGPSALRIAEPGAAALVEISIGSVMLHGEGTAAVASVAGGSVAAQPGADAMLTVNLKVATIDAQHGETIVVPTQGTQQTLAAEQSASLRASGELTLAPPVPARTVVTITAGESPTVHDPRAPTPVRVGFGQSCPRSGVVEVANDRAFKKIVARSGGAGGANILLPTGVFNYRVRCPGARGAAGTVRIARDSGRTPLPVAAARTTVEMDGREYTVLYQNVLPELTLAWRNAARAKSYAFVIKPAKGGEKRILNTSPSLKLMSGELREGSYKVWVEPLGGTRSEEARVVIEFDNAAQSASIDRVDVTEGKIRVRGTVIEGSTVSATGATVDLDRQRRFSTEMSPGPRDDGVGVRIAHPRAGIHYYVMRTGPS